jgi:hypothetical protein
LASIFRKVGGPSPATLENALASLPATLEKSVANWPVPFAPLLNQRLTVNKPRPIRKKHYEVASQKINDF